MKQFLVLAATVLIFSLGVLILSAFLSYILGVLMNKASRQFLDLLNALCDFFKRK